jgi:hypothetical protein
VSDADSQGMVVTSRRHAPASNGGPRSASTGTSSSRDAAPSRFRRRCVSGCTWISQAQVEITEREDGVRELPPTLAVPADEAWFWAERWQAGERRVDEHVAAGQVIRHDDAKHFLVALDALDDE